MYKLRCRFLILFFFFQAEDGIRDIGVTGVQTCALPISVAPTAAVLHLVGDLGSEPEALAARYAQLAVLLTPSEEGVRLVRSLHVEPRGGGVGGGAWGGKAWIFGGGVSFKKKTITTRSSA